MLDTKTLADPLKTTNWYEHPSKKIQSSQQCFLHSPNEFQPIRNRSETESLVRYLEPPENKSVSNQTTKTTIKSYRKNLINSPFLEAHLPR